MSLVEELDALKSALDIEGASRAVVQSLLQRGEEPGSAGTVHEETIVWARIVAALRRVTP